MKFDGPLRSPATGFSLVEMLVVIAVIGIMAALAIPGFRGIVDSSAVVRDRQNARCLASVCQSAQAAGVEFVDPDGDLEQTIRNIQAGGEGTVGAFNRQVFRVNIDDDHIEGAARYLRIEAGSLLFDEIPDPQ
jgi:prepilin-type N-terminal cleavage/methylation domain-containing protein